MAANLTGINLLDVSGRNFSGLSLSPDGSEILFIEFDSGLSEVSRVLLYQIHSKRLQYYKLPQGYIYFDAAFSPNGKSIALRRVPNVTGDDEAMRRAYAESEIVIMQSDGSSIRKIPLSGGLKISPTISHDGRFVAYWRATQRPDGSKSFASKHDVYEFDLKTEREHLFAGQYQFFSGGQLQYSKDDSKLLINGDTPTSDLLPGRTQSNFSEWQREYNKKYKRGEIYLLSRDQTSIETPLMSQIEDTSMATLDKGDAIFFRGFNPYISFFRSSNGDLKQWDYPWKIFGPEMSNVVVSQAGNQIYFNFRYLNSPTRDFSKKGIGFFDVEKNTWQQIDIPPIKTAVPIFVKQ